MCVWVPSPRALVAPNGKCHTITRSSHTITRFQPPTTTSMARHGKTKLLVETKKYRECSMIYGPNFRNRNGSFVINSVKISEMALDAIYLWTTRLASPSGSWNTTPTCSSGVVVVLGESNLPTRSLSLTTWMMNLNLFTMTLENYAMKRFSTTW